MSEQFVFDANVNINQVQKIVKSMAPNISPGIYKIPVPVIKDCVAAIPVIKDCVAASNFIDYESHLSFCTISLRLQNCGSDN